MECWSEKGMEGLRDGGMEGWSDGVMESWHLICLFVDRHHNHRASQHQQASQQQKLTY